MQRQGVEFIPVLVLIFLLGAAGVCSGYIIGEEDVLQISVWGNPDLGIQVPVRPDGKISVPLVDEVIAAGRTPVELKKALETEYEKYVKGPVVSVVVTSVNSFKVYVFGEGISRPSAGSGSGASLSGVITLKRNTTLLQLLAQLGSLRDADLIGAYLLRGKQKVQVDFFTLMNKGDISLDVELKPNDVIFIPYSFQNRIRVVGAVRNPTVMPYLEGMTALDAILSSGGFTEFAGQNNVVVLRKEGGQIKSIEARLKDVIKDGDLSKNVPLRPGDFVMVR